MAGHSGEFSGYYCKIATITDGKLLCIQSRSQDEEASAITYVDEGDQRFVNPGNYNLFEPKQPLDFQQWLMLWMPQQTAYKIVNRKSGLLLCVEGRSTGENHGVIQYRDQQLSFQWWQVETLGDHFKLVNKHSGKVLTAKSGSVVQQTSDSQSQIQQWNISSLVFSGYIGEYKIQNVNASKLLCIQGQSIGDNAGAIIHGDQSLNFQWWRLFAHGWDNGAFEIENTQSGKLLCIESGSTSDDARAIQYHDQELPFQKWNLSLVSSGSDQIKITNAKSNLLLCVQYRDTGNNSPVIQYQDQSLSFQWWKFVRLSGEMDLTELIIFYHSPPELSRRLLQASDLDPEMCPELLLWYQNFIQTFALEVLGLLGVFPTPSLEDLASISNLILGDASTLAQLQLILAIAFTVDAFISIIDLFWKKDLWSQIFRLLLKKIWSLPTLVKATATVLSWIVGAGEARTAIMLTKSVVVLALLNKEKPECK